MSVYTCHHRRCSVAKSCLTPCNSTDCSTPDILVLHYLLEFTKVLVQVLLHLIDFIILLLLGKALNLVSWDVFHYDIIRKLLCLSIALESYSINFALCWYGQWFYRFWKYSLGHRSNLKIKLFRIFEVSDALLLYFCWLQ